MSNYYRNRFGKSRRKLPHSPIRDACDLLSLRSADQDHPWTSSEQIDAELGLYNNATPSQYQDSKGLVNKVND